MRARILPSTEPRPLSTGLQVLFILVALVLVLVLAGVPEPDRVAGDGSDKLRHGWARQRAEAAESAAPDAPAPADAPR